MENEKTIALLIDGDNISYKYLPTIISELNKQGKIVIKRVYGDFSNKILSAWKKQALKYSLNCIHSFAFTTNKSSTDSALIVDCMDILYRNDVDIYCICSSDSDFIHLVQRIKEDNKQVLGMGEEKTIEAFKGAVDRFYPLGVIKNYKKTGNNNISKKISDILKNKDEIEEINLNGNNIEDLYKVFVYYVNELTEKEESVHLSNLSTYLYKQHPEFDIRSYKLSKPLDLLKKYQDTFEVISLKSVNDPSKVSLYVKLKGKNNA
ncbi:MAG: NYN domain-containing protein [Bacillales bacterium]